MKGLLGGALAASCSSGLSSHHDDPPREQQSTRRTSQQQSTPARTATSITSTTCTSSDTCPPSAASVCPRFVKECYLSAEEKGAIASNNCSEFVIYSVCVCVFEGIVLSHYHSFENYFLSRVGFIIFTN